MHPEGAPIGTPDVATESTKVVTPPSWDAAKRGDLDNIRQEFGILTRRFDEVVAALSKSASTSTFSSMDVQAERDRTSALIAASEARTDTKMVQVTAKLDALMTEVQGSRADGKTTRTVVTTTMIGSVLALAALMYALVSYGATQFYNGTTIYDHLHATVTSPTK